MLPTTTLEGACSSIKFSIQLNSSSIMVNSPNRTPVIVLGQAWTKPIESCPMPAQRASGSMVGPLKCRKQSIRPATFKAKINLSFVKKWVEQSYKMPQASKAVASLALLSLEFAVSVLSRVLSVPMGSNIEYLSGLNFLELA